MKIVSLELKKIEIGKFFPKQDQLELSISFNDGDDKKILKLVDMDNPENSAESILVDLRKIEKKLNKENKEQGSIIDNYVNIVIKDEERLVRKISELIQKAKNKVDGIKSKSEAEGYLDLIRDLKSLKCEF